MSRINVGDHVYVNPDGSTVWLAATVLSAVHPTEGPWCVVLGSSNELWAKKGHIVGSLSEIKIARAQLRSTQVTAEPFPGHDFTEDDEPMGEVPDLPPVGWGGALPESAFMHTSHPCTVEPILDSLDIRSFGRPSAIPRKEYAPGGWTPTDYDPPRIDKQDPARVIDTSTFANPCKHEHVIDPPRGPRTHYMVHKDGCVSRWTGTKWENISLPPGARIPREAPAFPITDYRIDIHTTEKEPDVRQNPDAPVTMGVPGDHYTQDKVSYPQEQRRDALAQAYGILTETSTDYVDVSDAIRLAEYIMAGTDYADTTRSIQAEAMRAETDAAVEVAVSKLLDSKAA